jgi:hypothetical protein
MTDYVIASKLETLLEKVYNIHDVECNQKYDETLPYSFHLKLVVNTAKIFAKRDGKDSLVVKILMAAAAGHDLIEDARMSYNDVKYLYSSVFRMKEATLIADIIYACTEEKGKNREERHSDNFYEELKENHLAVFVKLCDISCNMLYSLLTRSSMFDVYKHEYPKLKERLDDTKLYNVNLWHYLNSIMEII